METDEHILKYEQERFRLITSTEEVAATAAGLSGFLSGVATDIYLSGKFSSSDGETHKEHNTQAAVSNNHTLQGIAPKITINKSESKKHQMSAKVSTPSSHNKFVPLEYQALGIVGIISLAAFSAAAISSGIRYAIHRRKVNFKSDISPQELKEWYANSSIN